jgi:copper homeostasis protein
VTAAVAAGADGVAAGVLRGDGTIDDGALARLIEAAAPAPLTFHRAFDLIDDQLAALSLLERLGVRRVLTSGAAATAWEGRHRLAALAAAAGPSLTLLPGGGIQADHVLELIRVAGATEIHLSGVKFTGDGGPFGFGRAGRPDVERVAAVVAAVRG